MGGRGNAGNRNTSSFFSTKEITEDSFVKSQIGSVTRWESKVQIVDAVALQRDDNGKAIGANKSLVPAYTIVEDSGKYKIYRTQFGGRRRWLKTEKDFKKAVKFVNEYHKGEIE